MTNLQLLNTSLAYLRQRLKGARLAAMVASVVLMLLAGWLTNLPAILLGEAVDLIVQGNADTFRLILPSLKWIAIVLLGKEVANWLRKYIVERVATALEREEFVKIVQQTLRLNLSQVSDERIGALNKRIDRSVEGVIRLIKLVFLDFLPTILVASVAIYFATARHWLISLLMLAVAVIGAVITVSQVRSQKGIRIDLFRAKEEISANVVELLQGIEYVRASGAIREEVAKAERSAAGLQQKEFRHHRYMMSFDVLKQLVEGAGFVGVIAGGAWLASRGMVSEGEVLTFAVLFGSVATPLRELHRVIDEGFEAMLRIEDLFSIYRMGTDPGLEGRAEPKLGGDVAAIACMKVSVEYGANAARKQALCDVTVRIERGSTIGIAGASGSGKSTFARLLLGLIPGYSGSVKVFGTEVREIDKFLLAGLVAYVPQVPFLVHGTVRENVLYGLNRQEYGEKDIWSALRRSQVAGHVGSLPGGLDAAVTEQGRNLSGGERQRVVLARVFLKGAAIVLLDEATAALDAANERLVQEAIDELVIDRTALIIAHRLSTLRSAQRILLFDKGGIVAEGTFQHLAKESVLFRKLVKESERTG